MPGLLKGGRGLKKRSQVKAEGNSKHSSSDFSACTLTHPYLSQSECTGAEDTEHFIGQSSQDFRPQLQNLGHPSAHSELYT